MTLAEWQAKGNDPMTTANVYPADDATLLGLARNVAGSSACLTDDRMRTDVMTQCMEEGRVREEVR